MWTCFEPNLRQLVRSHPDAAATGAPDDRGWRTRLLAPATPLLQRTGTPRPIAAALSDHRATALSAGLPGLRADSLTVLPPPCQGTGVAESCVVTPGLSAHMAPPLGDTGELPPALPTQPAEVTSWHRWLLGCARSRREAAVAATSSRRGLLWGRSAQAALQGHAGVLLSSALLGVGKARTPE